MKAWWRRNRWWLVVMPVTMLLMLGASSFRIREYWWDTDYRSPIAVADEGEWLRMNDTAAEFGGTGTKRDFRVRLLAVERTDEARLGDTSQPLPDGVAAWSFDFEIDPTDPEQFLGCSLVLVDADGRRYGGPGGPTRPTPCADVSAIEGPDGSGTFVSRSYGVVPEGTEITQAWLTFETPKYLAFRLP